jgi:hypothetical protein
MDEVPELRCIYKESTGAFSGHGLDLTANPRSIPKGRFRRGASAPPDFSLAARPGHVARSLLVRPTRPRTSVASGLGFARTGVVRSVHLVVRHASNVCSGSPGLLESQLTLIRGSK